MFPKIDGGKNVEQVCSQHEPRLVAFCVFRRSEFDPLLLLFSVMIYTSKCELEKFNFLQNAELVAE